MNKLKLAAFMIMSILSTELVYAQYEFKDDKNSMESTAVKSQGRTGTCWSFATTSFLESELIRMGKGNIDLSEMYTVRKVYENKANNYVLRNGKANFSQGSLSHDMIRTLKDNGVVPDENYSGLLDGASQYNHGEMEKGLKGFLDGVIAAKKPSKNWKKAFNAILNVYMGNDLERFSISDMRFTPKSYADYLGLKAENYISITSFTHHPFYESFVLEIPDNYSNGSFYNVPMDKMMEIIDNAVDNGYSVAWDGDVSEKGFSGREGIAVLAADNKREDLYKIPGEELKVTQTSRQEAFDNYNTTDDHLMHIVGSAKDKNGKKYYIIKNSWGEIGPFKGKLYMSEAYVQMKTVAILLHKDALPSNTIK